MNILVTGCAGFIGSHLTDRLLELGHTVIGIDNMLTGNKDNLSLAIQSPRFKLYMCDIRDPLDDIVRFNDVSFIFHEAADARIPSSTSNPKETSDINIMGTINLLDTAVENNCKLAFASSSSVYGNYKRPVNESDNRNPSNIYGVQKLAGEELVMKYHDYHGLKSVALRYFNVYGSTRQNEKGAYVNIFASLNKARKTNTTFFIYGDGECVRDYVNVHDVVNFNVSLLTMPDTWAGWGKAINVGTGIATSVNEVVELSKYDNAKHADARIEDVPYSCADTTIADSLGLRADISIDRGIKQLWGVN